jgi:DNA-binding MarR family transcriptional regulator
LAAAGGGQCRTLQDIAADLGVTRSGATRVVDRLEHRGLAVRCCSTSDRRCTCVELTERGRAALDEAARCFTAVIDEVLTPLTAAERRTLASSLSTLAGLVRRYRHERTPL